MQDQGQAEQGQAGGGNSSGVGAGPTQRELTGFWGGPGGEGCQQPESQQRTEQLFGTLNRTETLLFMALDEVQQHAHWRGLGCESFEDYCQRLGLNQEAVDVGLRALREFREAGCDDAELVATGLASLIALRNGLEARTGLGRVGRERSCRWDARQRHRLLRLVRERGLLPGQLQDQRVLGALIEESTGRAAGERRVRRPRGGSAESPESEPEARRDPADEIARQKLLSRISSQLLQGPPARWPDPPHGFAIKPEHWRELVLTIHIVQNGLLVGPTGSGKSLLIKLLAAALQRPYFSFNLGGTLDPRSELLGTTQLRGGQTTFCDAHFLRALQTPGAVIALDELNRCDGMFLNLLNPILDGQRTVVVGERLDAPVVDVAPGICFFGIANVGPEYAHTVPLDRAMIDRFDIKLPIDYPSQREEEQLLLQHFPRLDETEAQKLALLAAQQRQLAVKSEYNLYVSTRMLFAAAARAAWGGSLWQAVEYTIATKFSDSGEGSSQRLKFRMLAQKILGSAA